MATRGGQEPPLPPSPEAHDCDGQDRLALIYISSEANMLMMMVMVMALSSERKKDRGRNETTPKGHSTDKKVWEKQFERMSKHLN